MENNMTTADMTTADMTTAEYEYSDYSDYGNDEYYDIHDLQIFKSISIMSIFIYSVVCVLGVFGNGVVIWATGFRMKKTVSTVWYLNLAMADFLATAFLTLRITYRALGDYWPFGWFMYIVDGISTLYVSIYTLVVISVDRCVCVVCPVWTRNHRTVRKASWVSLGVWVLALVHSISYFIISTKPSVFKPNKDPDFRLIITNFLMGFVLPFSVIVSCYSVIIYRVRNNRSLAGQSGRSFKIIAAVIAAFFLCWLPFHMLWLIYAVAFETLGLVLSFGFPITRALALLNSCLNPLLYVFSQGFKDVFRSRSILKVLEKAFAEEPPQTNNTHVTHTDPAVTQMMTP